MAIPGARFLPTEKELITQYLDKRLKRLPYSTQFVTHCDLYTDKSTWQLFSDQTDPWQTIKVSDKKNGVRIERVIHVITPLKNISRCRINRPSGCGVWHEEGGPLDIRDDDDKIIGHERTYSFKVTAAVGNIPRQGHWIMHEFSSTMSTNTEGGAANNINYVICRISRDDSKPVERAKPSSTTTCNGKDCRCIAKKAYSQLT